MTNTVGVKNPLCLRDELVIRVESRITACSSGPLAMLGLCYLRGVLDACASMTYLC